MCIYFYLEVYYTMIINNNLISQNRGIVFKCRVFNNTNFFKFLEMYRHITPQSLVSSRIY